ncbi:hypothetical protein HanPSC8_Chr04g0170101 [Helianthus annuus]|nr:hypothetical protein HanPSC8_Chr04g0170101 [Helianthus annuus]
MLLYSFPVHNAFNFVLQFHWRSFSCLLEFLLLFVWLPFLSSYVSFVCGLFCFVLFLLL